MLRLLLLYLTINHSAHFIVTDEISDDVKELKNAPPDHVIPYSEHEDPPEPPTKPKYIAPGVWAKPSSNKSITLDFVPTRVYTQVRRTHTKKHLPREEALKHATTDEEKENAARLKEVVTKRKINTVYTEEGYEDAAYDHAGHIRDADINESYSQHNHIPKTKQETQKKKFNSDEINDDDSVIDPKFIIENEVEKLKEDLDREDKEAAKRAETEVPENLRDLTDDSGSYDYEDEQRAKPPKQDYDYEDKESDRASSTESLSNNFEETAAIEVSTKIPKTVKHFEESFDTFHPTNFSVRDIASDLKQLSSFEDESTPTDYGQVFWEYFKTEKPITTTAIPQDREHQISTPTIELQTSASSKSTRDEIPMYPSLSQIYESWKQRGIEQSYKGMSPGYAVNKIIETTTESDNDEQSVEKTQKKNYMVMVRGRKNSKNDSSITNPPRDDYRHDNNGQKHLPNNIDPEMNNYSTVKNMTVINPPVSTPLRQVTYTDFLHDTYGNLINPTVTQESGSSMEQTIPETTSYSSDTAASLVGPATTPPIYRYHPHQHRHHRHHHHQQHQPLTRQNRKRQILSLIKMLPPSPISRSEYAQYYEQNRIGSVKSDHDPWPDVYKNYQSVYHHNGKTSHRTKRFLTKIDMGLDSEKVIVKGMKTNYQSLDEEERKRRRKKRHAEKLLVKAPIVVDGVINKEIESRFPDNSEDDDGTEKNYSVSSENEQRDKVEVEVPEYNFPDIAEVLSDEEEDEYNSSDAAEARDDGDDGDDDEKANADEPPNESIDDNKYPFYNNNQIPRASPLKYVLNPLHIPQKTDGGSEFYDSRDKYMRCDEIEENFSKELPENEEPIPDGDIKKNLPRLRNLGDKLSCLRDKYFDKNPLDNPLFKEKRIEAPEMPEELNPIALKLAFSTLVGDPDANAVRRVSRKPEIIDLRPSDSHTNQVTELENKNKNSREVWNNHARRYRGRQRTTTAIPDAVYQRQVYEDVMGTIKNMAHMYQSPPPPSKSSMKPIRISKANSNINYSSESSRERDKNDKNLHIPARQIGSPSPILTVPQTAWRYKLLPYRTNRVSYKTRPRIDSVPGSNIPRVVGYFKTVRVHKRSVDSLGLDVNRSKESSNNILARNATRRRRMKIPKSTVIPEISTQASQRVVHTIDDRLKHSKPRGRVRYGQFTAESTTSNENTRRNEPRYTPIRKFDDDIHKLKYLNKKGDLADDTTETNKYSSVVGRNEGVIEPEPQYDVREEVQEPTTEAPIILGTDKSEETVPAQYSEDNEGSGQSEESPSPSYREEESRDDGNEDETEDKESDNDDNDDDDDSGDDDEQMERPSESYTKNSGEGSGEVDDKDESSHETPSYDEEKNASHRSEGEEEFERFAARPFSSFDSNFDEKYSDLGPRVSKPEFYHPPFDSLKPKKLSKYREQSDDTSDEYEEKRGGSKYTFPWERDDEGASEESRRYERFSGKHEYPWERRERLAKQRRLGWRDDDDVEASNEQHESGTMTRIKQVYPWERYDLPSIGFGVSKAANYFSPMYEFDNYGFSSQFRPVKFSSRYQSKLKPPQKYIEKQMEEISKINDNGDDDGVVSTTYVSQIPATSATFPSLIRETTTPLPKIDTSPRVYTVRPRFRALGTTQTTIQTTTLPSSRFKRPLRRGQPTGMTDTDEQSSSSSTNPENRRRSRMTTLTTTLKPSLTRGRFRVTTEHKSTTPTTTRNTEHRSKVSKEEIMTKMTFPDSGTSDTQQRNLSPRNTVVKKVSIVTKETPEHIYRTEEVDKDGVKGMYFSISPNHKNNETSVESDKMMTMDKIEREEPSDAGSISGDSPGFDISLPIPENAMLSEHGTRKIVSSVSWISENYDF